MPAGGRVGRHELQRVARGYFVQRRHGAQLVVRRLVVGFLRVRHGRLFAHALLHLRNAHRVHRALRAAGRVVAAQRQSPHAPVEIVRALALRKSHVI